MSKDLSLKSVNLKTLFNKYSKGFSKHAIFGAVILVLLVYLFLVFKISKFAQAEPPAGQTPPNPLSIPTVDKKAIAHIQSLEQNNTQLHSLFEQARNNPFQE
jgi:hypothetical protein